MTIAQAIDALRVIDTIPLAGDHAFVPALILIRADLRRIARDLEPQRLDILAAAKEAAGVPDTFDADLADYLADPGEHPDFKPILDAVDARFAPAWVEVTAAEAPLRFPLLTPALFAGLYAAHHDTLTPAALDTIASLLVE